MRIRSVKPEFWSSEDIGTLTRDARLFYIATWNVADDEGLLEWSPRKLKAYVFPYDEDLTLEQVTGIMEEIVEAGFVYTYEQTTLKQAPRRKSTPATLGWIVKFPSHQRPNRPQPSRLDPPPVDVDEVLFAYAYRDKWMCHQCGKPVDDSDDATTNGPALDHVDGPTGPEYPMSIRLAHRRCAKTPLRSNDEAGGTSTWAPPSGPVLSVVPEPSVAGRPVAAGEALTGTAGARAQGPPQAPPGARDAGPTGVSEAAPNPGSAFFGTRFSECSSPEGSRRGEGREGEGFSYTSPGIFRHLPKNDPHPAPARPNDSSGPAAAQAPGDDALAPTDPDPVDDFPAPDFPAPDFPTPDFPTPDFPTPDFPTPDQPDADGPPTRGRPKITVPPDRAQFIENICNQIAESAEEATGRRVTPTDRWRTDVERLLRVDGYTEGQVATAVRWVTEHGYWRTQITTGRHLRSQFDEVFTNEQFARWTVDRKIPDDDRPPSARGRRVSRTFEDSLTRPVDHAQ